MDKAEVFLICFTIICMLLLGWTFNEIYDGFIKRRDFNGIYIYAAENESIALDIAQRKDNRGDWVCINVAYDMTFEEAIITCSHECQHKAFAEIWAENCEENFDGCLEHLGGYVE